LQSVTKAPLLIAPGEGWALVTMTWTAHCVPHIALLVDTATALDSQTAIVQGKVIAINDKTCRS